MTNYLREATDTEVLAALPHVWEGSSGRKYPDNVRDVKLKLNFATNEVSAFVYTDRITATAHIVWDWDTEVVKWFDLRV